MFLKNLLTLFSGTALAQLLPLLAIPVLSRQYHPADFGVYGLFIAGLTLCSVFCTLRFEIATAQAKTDPDASGLFIVTLLVSSTLSVFIFISILFSSLFFEAVKAELLIYLLLPLGGFLMAVVQLISYFFNRFGMFKNTAKLKVIQAISTILAMVAMPEFGSFGLIFGHLIGFLVFIVVSTKYLSTMLRVTSLNVCRNLAFEYKSYALVSAPGSVFNTAFLQLPTFYINKTFDQVTLGFFSFINRYIAGPLSLLSVATSQVFLNELSQGRRGKITKLFKKLSIINASIGLLFIAFSFVAAEPFIRYILGNSWLDMVYLLQILSFSIAVRFIVSPLSVVLTRSDNLKLSFQWQVFSCISVILFLGAIDFEESIVFFKYFVILDVFLYSLYYAQIARGLKYYES